MLDNLIILIAGLALLIKGADYFVAGASALAKRFGVPDLVIGLTVVALGTSMPELVVSSFAALRGAGDVAVANALGSNIANIGLILGLAALVRPLRLAVSTVWKEIPMSVFAVVAFGATAADSWFKNGTARLDRFDAAVLLTLALLFLYYVLALATNGRPFVFLYHLPERRAFGGEYEYPGAAKTAAWTLGGLALLIFGGRLAVTQAVALAAALGIPDRLIGLTVVAIGTSLPELATSVVAARRGKSDLAVGNVIGSNIVNVLLVLGLAATLRPLTFSLTLFSDAVIVLMFTLLLFVFMFVGRRHELERWQGAMLLALYAGYLASLVWRSQIIK